MVHRPVVLGMLTAVLACFGIAAYMTIDYGAATPMLSSEQADYRVSVQKNRLGEALQIVLLNSKDKRYYHYGRSQFGDVHLTKDVLKKIRTDDTVPCWKKWSATYFSREEINESLACSWDKLRPSGRGQTG